MNYKTIRKYFRRRRKNRARTRFIREYCIKEEASLQALFETCLEHISPITIPPVFVSQMPHSGDLLLNRLLDGHPEIYAYPDELLQEIPAKIPWTEIGPEDDPQHRIEFLFDCFAAPDIQHGFRPDTKYTGTFPFVFLPLLQKQIFIKYLNTLKLIKPRDVFDAHMTSCFGAWLDYQNHSQQKKFVTLLAPRPVALKENMEAYLNMSPDCRVIFLIENPHDWYNSALQAEPGKPPDVNKSMRHWQESLDSALWAKARFSDRTCLIKFEDLVNRTEPVMQYLAEFLGIPYDPVLAIQTFNSYPISSGISKKIEAVTVAKRHNIDYPNGAKDQSKIIAEMTNDDYRALLEAVVSFSDR